MLKLSVILLFSFAISGCSQVYKGQMPKGKVFPTVKAESLDKKVHQLPEYFSGRQVVLLLGYKQDSQFDIDRWLIGLDMTQTAVDVYELPTIQGWFPRQIKGVINDGMRKGIPDELWSIVLTVYQDGERLQQFTGNQNPNNARVIVLNEQAEVIYFYDRGFSVTALNALRQSLSAR